MLNVEFVKQFAEFGAILAGFSMAIAFSLLLHTEAASMPSFAPPKCASRLLPIAAGAFLASGVILVLGVLISAWILSLNSAIPEGQAPPREIVSGTEWVFYLTLAGGAALLAGIAMSGFLRSKSLGWFTVALSVLALFAAVVLYSVLAPGGG